VKFFREGKSMKISDIISQKVSMESLLERKKSEKFNNLRIDSSNRKADSILLNRKPPEISSIIELQSNFNKNIASLNGFMEMERKIKEFQLVSDNKKDFERLSRELTAISKSVKYRGENVISYLSTDIKDEASLYAFKMNLSKEIESLKAAIAKERKALASYIVENENKDAVAGFSPENLVEKIKMALRQNLTDEVHNLKSNSGKLFTS
jgi:hypothetical protein